MVVSGKGQGLALEGCSGIRKMARDWGFLGGVRELSGATKRVVSGRGQEWRVTWASRGASELSCQRSPLECLRGG